MGWLSALSLIVLSAVALGFTHWLYRLLRLANQTDWGNPGLNLLDGLNRLFCRRFHRLDAAITLPIPAQGSAVVVANHVSGLDPLLLIAASRRPLRFLIAREQYERFGLRWLFRAVGCIPVDRQGRPERALREALKSLERGEVVAVFPEGRIHLPTDRPAGLKPGAAMLARKTGSPVVACRIEGVRGTGRVIGAVFIRSQVHLHLSGPARSGAIEGPQGAAWMESALRAPKGSMIA